MDFLQDWLGGNPSAVYSNWYSQLNGTPTQKSYYQGQYGNVYNQYQGKLANTAMQGNIPTLNFQDYLKNFPWLKEFQNQSSYVTGYNPGNMSPRMRYLWY